MSNKINRPKPDKSVARDSDGYYSHQFNGALTLKGRGVMSEMGNELSVMDETAMSSASLGNAIRVNVRKKLR